MKSKDTRVCHLSGRTGTVELLTGFLNSSVNKGLTDRPMYTDRHIHLHVQYIRLTLGGKFLHTFQDRIPVVRPDVQVSKLCSLSGRYLSFSREWDSVEISSSVVAEFFCGVVSISICFLLPFLTRVLLHRAVHLSDITLSNFPL